MPFHRPFPLVFLAALLVPAGDAAAAHGFDLQASREDLNDPDGPECDDLQECIDVCHLSLLCYAEFAAHVAHALLCTSLSGDGHLTVGVGLPPGEPCTLNVSTRQVPLGG